MAFEAIGIAIAQRKLLGLGNKRGGHSCQLRLNEVIDVNEFQASR